MTTWLYHINPKRPGYRYGWDVERPRTLLKSTDKEWPARQMFRTVAVGDTISVYMKNIHPNPDGVYVLGTVTGVDLDERTFFWKVDEKRSARTLAKPITTSVVRSFFGRGYGGSMQRLSPAKQQQWSKLFAIGEIAEGAPLIRARGVPPARSPTSDPLVSREHGLRAELHVIKVLAKRYPTAKGFGIVHVSKQNSGADHDIAVVSGGRTIRLVEVKARVGTPGDPVAISERELACRRMNQSTHSIFVVYLSVGGSIRTVIEIDSRDSFALKPRQHWLTPGLSSSGSV